MNVATIGWAWDCWFARPAQRDLFCQELAQ
jgi:hypothetical protein